MVNSHGTVVGARARAIAFYLPQFHPIAENDEWWGKGFTEWTNTAKARPLFPGHYQPHIPADLGFYDLRLAETRVAQAEMARAAGVEAFCYYHYWFAGRRILERPFEAVLRSGEPDFPFCLCWANMTWTGVWHGSPKRVLIEQTYPGREDDRRHFEYLLHAFRDPRYLRVDGKPVLVIYNPDDLPDAAALTSYWRELAVRAGLGGLYLVAERRVSEENADDRGFDAVVRVLLPGRRRDAFSVAQRARAWLGGSRRLSTQNVRNIIGQLSPWRKIQNLYAELRHRPTVYRYADVIRQLVTESEPSMENYPCVIPNWDNTPRSGWHGLVLHESTPELFRQHVRHALDVVAPRPPEHRIVFVKSWNEWAEGNHLEPDERFGHGYLDVLKDELSGR
jgi:lipopolysaccharide biosynthesis protein